MVGVISEVGEAGLSAVGRDSRLSTIACGALIFSATEKYRELVRMQPASESAAR